MCGYFTGIITRTGRVLTHESHSHNKIIAENKLDDTKEHIGFLPFEIKQKVEDRFAGPTKNNWELHFQIANGQSTFKVPEWYKASFDRRIWDAFAKEQNRIIEENKEEIERLKKEEEKKRKEEEKIAKLKRIPDFKIVLAEPSFLKDNIRIIKGLVGEARIIIDKEKLLIVEMDPANVAMVIFRLLSSACVEWKVPKRFVMSLNINNLNHILKNAKVNDLIEITKKEDKKISILLKGRSRREYILPVIEMEEKEESIPELKFNATVRMPSGLFEEQVDEADTIAESCIFRTDKDIFEIKAEGDLSELRIENKEDEDIKIKSEGEVICKYSIEYLKTMAQGKKVSDEVKLEFSKDYPLRLTYNNPDRYSLTFILAPRVETE